MELGIETLRYWFGFKNDSQEYILDVILGFTPSNNRLAVRYIQKVGMHIVGEIPGIKFGVDSEGAVLSYIKRSEVK
ncbi:MAG: hypothetical protein GWN14_00665 [candidate division Zixibacteria bacterium]|nr:hypothetical protein [Gammaproteobacteria bacterium]NIX54472.1 hypothetical protein [candidate division Zixibacteria bacterium]